LNPARFRAISSRVFNLTQALKRKGPASVAEMKEVFFVFKLAALPLP
jgi:hypothetical protein